MKNLDKDDQPTFFVSRRGRQVGVHEVDLSDIDVESNNLPTINNADKRRPTKVKRAASQKSSVTSKSPRAPFRWTKKKMVIGAGILAVILLPVLFAELIAAQYRSAVLTAKADMGKYVGETVLPDQKKTIITADQVQGYANEVNAIVGRMCRGGLLDNAAGLYPRAKAALEECRVAQTTYATLANSLYGLEAEASYLEKIDALVKPVATPITDAYAIMGAQQTAWQTFSEGLKKLSPPEKMKTAHIILTTEVAEVTDAWSKLNTANNSQDSATFQESEKILIAKYESVRSTSAAFSEVLAGTQAKIQTDYNALR